MRRRAWMSPDARQGIGDEAPGGVALAGLADVDQVVGNARAQRRARGLAVPMSRPR